MPQMLKGLLTNSTDDEKCIKENTPRACQKETLNVPDITDGHSMFGIHCENQASLLLTGECFRQNVGTKVKALIMPSQAEI